jgi:hypothetical protein
MRLIYGFTFSVLLALGAVGVAAEEKGKPESNSLAGAWVGRIAQFTTKKLPDSDTKPDSYQIMFLNCDDSPQFWIKSDERGFNRIHKDYKVESKSGNYIVSLIVDGGGWVETQTWTLVSISPTKAAIQWNRMVSNPGLEEDAYLRSFGQMGYGDLEKISDSCDIWEKKGDKST